VCVCVCVCVCMCVCPRVYVCAYGLRRRLWLLSRSSVFLDLHIAGPALVVFGLPLLLAVRRHMHKIIHVSVRCAVSLALFLSLSLFFPS
jgi:hypothetical protein